MKSSLWMLGIIVMALGLTSSAQAVADAPNRPVIIFDTDMGSDVDDAGALALLHRLADLGEVEIAGVIFSSGKNRYGVGVCAAINTWYGRGDLPLGQYQRDDVGDPNNLYSRQIATATNVYHHHVIDQAADLVKVYKEVLRSTRATSVTILTVGHPHGLVWLMRDAEGADLVKTKVLRWVVMAGAPEKPGQDWNLGANGVSAYMDELLSTWPTPAYFSPVGETVITGNRKLPVTPGNNPVREAYRLWNNALEKGRSSWDQVAVLYAARPHLFEVQPGTMRHLSGPNIVWDSKATNAKHFKVTPRISENALAELIEGLMAAPPDKGLSPEVDVCVYGSVPCGIASAVAAAREGASVVLIEPTGHVGGLNTSGINTAESEHMLAWTIGGLALEFYQRLGRHYGTGKPEFYFESSVAEQVFNQMLKEAKVTVRFGQRVAKVEKEGTRIRRIVLTDGSAVAAKVFVDAGYEGDLMARAGVNWASGREGRDEFGEDAAGVRFDKTPRRAATVDGQGKLLPGISGWASDFKQGAAHPAVMNYNFRLTFAKDPAKRVPIPAPQHYDRSRYRLLENLLNEKSARHEAVKLADLLDFYPRRNGKFEVNNKQAAVISLGHFGGQLNYPGADYPERDRIVADHWDYTLGLLKFLAEDESVPEALRAEMRAWGLHKDEFADNGNLPYQLYVREARRMRGAFVVTQRDVTEDRRKSDAIGISSHFIDCHHVQRVALSPSEFVNEGRIWRMGRAYQIPYRALTPKPTECRNLLVPGAASFSHVAFCTYRLESVWMIGGHAAGAAAAMAAKENRAVQQVNTTALQNKLHAQKQVIDFLPGQPETCEHLNGPPEF